MAIAPRCLPAEALSLRLNTAKPTEGAGKHVVGAPFSGLSTIQPGDFIARRCAIATKIDTLLRGNDEWRDRSNSWAKPTVSDLVCRSPVSSQTAAAVDLTHVGPPSDEAPTVFSCCPGRGRVSPLGSLSHSERRTLAGSKPRASQMLTKENRLPFGSAASQSHVSRNNRRCHGRVAKRNLRKHQTASSRTAIISRRSGCTWCGRRLSSCAGKTASGSTWSAEERRDTRRHWRTAILPGQRYKRNSRRNPCRSKAIGAGTQKCGSAYPGWAHTQRQQVGHIFDASPSRCSHHGAAKRSKRAAQ